MSLTRMLRFTAIVLSCAAALAALPATAGATATGHWWALPQNTNFIEQLIVPQGSPNDTFSALQANTTSGGVMYIGLQNPGGVKRVHFAIWDANGWYGTNCAEFSGEGSGLKCWQPFNYQDGQAYRVRMERKHNDGPGTWWEATILDAAGNSTYIAALRAPGAPTSINASASFLEYFGSGCPPPARSFVQAPTLLDSGQGAAYGSEFAPQPCAAGHTDYGFGGVALSIGGG